MFTQITRCAKLTNEIIHIETRLRNHVHIEVIDVKGFVGAKAERCFILPSFFSTVTPGQLPTYSLLPVIALKSVVLPQFGLPASASLTGRFSSNGSLVQTLSFEHMLFSIMKPVSSAARLCSAWSASRLSALCSRSSRARLPKV